ncbi:MAG: hypothetical protein AAGN35_15320 [Bacteroidota bacterium]
MQKVKTSSKSSVKGKGLLIGGLVTLGLAITGGAVWFFTRGSKKKSNSDLLLAESNDKPASTKPTTTSTTTTSSKWTTASFPIRRGMRGAAVKQLQKALLQRHGNVLPRYGADGDYGGETETALRNNGWPVMVSQAKFTEITAVLSTGSSAQGGGSTTTQGGSVVGPVDAKVMAQAINGKDLKTIGQVLLRMQTVADYSTVSNHLKRETTYNKFGRGASRNLVNALMGDDMPWNFAARAAFASQLKRMGLKYDSNFDRWSLSGIPSLGRVERKGAMTIAPTTAWDDQNRPVRIPGGVYLGTATNRGGSLIRVLTPEGNYLTVMGREVILA